MPGRIWPHLHSLCASFSYCQIKPPDHDTREHFPAGLDSLHIPKNGDYASSCSMYIGWIKGQSPPPPALSSPFCGIWGLYLTVLPSYPLTFLGCFCKLPSTSQQQSLQNHKKLSTTFACGSRKDQNAQGQSLAMALRDETSGTPGGAPLPASIPPTHLRPQAQQASPTSQPAAVGCS